MVKRFRANKAICRGFVMFESLSLWQQPLWAIIDNWFTFPCSHPQAKTNQSCPLTYIQCCTGGPAKLLHTWWLDRLDQNRNICECCFKHEKGVCKIKCFNECVVFVLFYWFVCFSFVTSLVICGHRCGVLRSISSVITWQQCYHTVVLIHWTDSSSPKPQTNSMRCLPETVNTTINNGTPEHYKIQ